MKKHIMLLLSLPLIVCLSLPAGADFKKTKVAVLDFQLQGEGFETGDMGAIVAEWFITALVRDGRLEVVERGLLKQILEEQKLGLSGVLDETTATRIGRLLGVETIISGSVLKLREVLEVNARIIDVETAAIIAAENIKTTTPTKLQDLVIQIARKIIHNFPLQGYIVDRNHRHIIIDLGRRDGVETGMRFMVYKEGKNIKHPKTGEILDVERKHTGSILITDVGQNTSRGEVIQEQRPGSVAYGHMVHSFADHLNYSLHTAKTALPSKAALYVITEPLGARVRILNIVPPYQDGILLNAGNYHIEVTAAGYLKKTQWISLLAGETKYLAVNLDRHPPSGAQGQDLTLKGDYVTADQSGLKLAVFPWQLWDEQLWGPDLSREKIVKALIKVTRRHKKVSLKYSYYPSDEGSGGYIRPIKSKIARKKVWDRWGAYFAPNRKAVLRSGRALAADLVLMGNLIYTEIDGEVDLGKYDLTLYLVDIRNGKVEKRTSQFNYMTIVNGIKALTKDLLNAVAGT